MKKPKSQSLDSKNGIHSDDSASMIVDEDLKQSHDVVVSPSSNSRAANLSRKKATPPNPSTKKLVIKLVKGLFFSQFLFLGYLDFFRVFEFLILIVFLF